MEDLRSWPELRGRRREREALDGFVDAARDGHGGVLVLRGEAGIGKSALLDVVVERATGCQLARATGVESEMELPYAGLHQLCRSYLDLATGLPAPQRGALATAFGLDSGRAPDRLLVGLAVLGLLCAAAAREPLICVVDDAQWLDAASAQSLAFAARRLGPEPAAMVFAVRDTDDEPPLAGLPELAIHGLGRADAEALLESAVPWPIDARVRDRVLAEAHGNPLALLELPRGMTATELVFGSAGAGGRPALANRLEQGFARQLTLLPRPARQLLLTAAADPVGDAAVVWRAAEHLGIGADAVTAAEASGLVVLGDRIRFRHPLVRSAVYRSATPAERRAVHSALADATDPEIDPARRVWHRAGAVVGTDESVATELERTAGRARSSGGVSAAAAFLETAAALTPDSARRAGRSLEAAEAKAVAGAFEEASSLLTAAQAGPLDETGRARTDILRAQVAYNTSPRDESLPLLLAAARRLERLDGRLSRATYLDALASAVSAGRLASGSGSGLRQVAEAARRAPAAESPGSSDLLLDALVVHVTEGRAAAGPLLRTAVQAFARADLAVEEACHGGWVATVAAADLWDDALWDVVSRRHLHVVRQAGALHALPMALANRAVYEIHSGDLAAAASLVAERAWLAGISDAEPRLSRMPEAWLAAVRGSDELAEPLIAETCAEARARGLGATLTMALCSRAVLCNGRGRYEEALAAARDAAAEPLELGAPQEALAELVEAGARAGQLDVAVTALEQLSETAHASGTDFALGVEAGRRALLDAGRPEDLHREAVERLGRTRMRVELARAQLRYGEWLRRQGRRVDARAQLREAHDGLSAMGVQAFAERARGELLATGETVRRRSDEAHGDLTAQEGQIARLAAEGLTNSEIAGQLYLSPRTVEWHLRKVFTKVGITTRRQLRRSLRNAWTG